MTLTHFIIPEQPRVSGQGMLDPITVFIENGAPGKGQITLRCYGRAWAAYWGGMGDGNTVQRFLLEVSADYAANCLIRGNNGIMLKSAEKRELAYVTAIVEAVQKHLRDMPAAEPGGPLKWDAEWLRNGFNGCLRTAANALRYLANNDRPTHGEQLYNAAHLLQTANEIELTQQKLLHPLAPVEPIIIVECKNLILGNSQFWRGPVSKIAEIRNTPARETAYQVAKDGKARVNGTWHVSVEVAA
jgi:hypothetical protein